MNVGRLACRRNDARQIIFDKIVQRYSICLWPYRFLNRAFLISYNLAEGALVLFKKTFLALTALPHRYFPADN